MTKRIIFIHGRSTKPCEKDLQDLWYEAIKIGLRRDFDSQAVSKFDHMNKSFVYFGDLSNAFLANYAAEGSQQFELNKTAIMDDLDSRRAALARLSRYKKADFNQENYRQLASQNAYKEFLADSFSGALSYLGLGTPLISLVAPDIGEYWNKKSYFASNIRMRLTKALRDAFDEKEDILLISHSLGSIISYDCLWKLSHYGEYRENYGEKCKLAHWISIGSPLADENVKKQLKGAQYQGILKYPVNIRRWTNISAEDDFISHDRQLQNDYIAMYQLGLIEQPIDDIYPIYNLSYRNASANPHSSLGYLVHPQLSRLVFDWIKT